MTSTILDNHSWVTINKQAVTFFDKKTHSAKIVVPEGEKIIVITETHFKNLKLFKYRWDQLKELLAP